MNAFVTYLCSDDFVPGVIALKKSLTLTGHTTQFVCMHTGNVSKDYVSEIQKNDISTICVEKVYPTNTRDIKDRYRDDPWKMYTKLQLWNLDFETVVYIDCDCLVVKNVESMFEMPELSAVRDAGYGGISAGVMVLKPSTDRFDSLVSVMNTHSYDDTYSDQSLTNYYFTEVVGSWNEIPVHYNTLQKRTQISNETMVFHYNGQKPWISDPLHACCWRQGTTNVFALWWNAYGATT